MSIRETKSIKKDAPYHVGRTNQRTKAVAALHHQMPQHRPFPRPDLPGDVVIRLLSRAGDPAFRA